jgi:hypothetical protein
MGFAVLAVFRVIVVSYQNVGPNLRAHLLAKFLTKGISSSLVAETVEFPCHNGSWHEHPNRLGQ